jgi:DNA-binding MarR family transcriptional regulator
MSDSAEVAAFGLLLGRLSRLNESLVDEVCADRGVSPAEYRVLAMLRHSDLGVGVRPGAISQWVVQTSGGLTATMGRLESAGRIERVTDPDDRRARRVRLTQDGRGFFEDLSADLMVAYQAVLSDLDLAAPTDTVRLLIEAFEQAASLPCSSQWDLGQQVAALG